MEHVLRTPLSQRLAKKTEESRRALPEAYYLVLRKSVAYLRDSGLFDGALAIGDPLPPFRLPSTSGRLVDSRELLARGPLVVSFFRGEWCRFCVETLRSLAEIDSEVRDLGGILVAITPDLPEATAQTVRNLNLPFEVLSDLKSAFGLKCGIAYRMPDDVAEVYHAMNFINRNGSADFFLPIPAVFIADRDGIVRLSYTEPDYAKRLEPEAIIETLRGLTRDTRGE
jgi:peroxiredoxin